MKWSTKRRAAWIVVTCLFLLWVSAPMTGPKAAKGVPILVLLVVVVVLALNGTGNSPATRHRRRSTLGPKV